MSDAGEEQARREAHEFLMVHSAVYRVLHPRRPVIYALILVGWAALVVLIVELLERLTTK